MTSQPLVGVVMGSDSDWPVMEAAADALDEFGVPCEVDVVSAHRMPQRHDRLRHRRGRARAAGHHRRCRRRGAPAGHARRRSPRCRSSACRCRWRTSTGSTRCCRSCRCRPASRSRPSRSAARATPACSPCGSWPRPTRRCAPRMVDFQAALRDVAQAKGAALRARLSAPPRPGRRRAAGPRRRKRGADQAPRPVLAAGQHDRGGAVAAQVQPAPDPVDIAGQAATADVDRADAAARASLGGLLLVPRHRLQHPQRPGERRS